MKIKILGTGCNKCTNLEKTVKETIEAMDIQAEVIMEEDIMKIMEYGIIRTPGLVINEKVVSSGRGLSKSEIQNLINQNQ